MIAKPSQIPEHFGEPLMPLLERLNTSDTAAMKNIVIRPIELKTGPGFHLTVMEAAYSFTQEMTGEQLGDYLRRQGDAYEHLPNVITSVRRSRRADRARGK